VTKITELRGAQFLRSQVVRNASAGEYFFRAAAQRNNGKYYIQHDSLLQRFFLVMSFLLLLPFLVFLILVVHSLVPRNQRLTSYDTAFSFLQKSSFEERASANQPLRRAFGISNPFVIGDKSFHDEYVKLVHRRLTFKTRDWSDIIQAAKVTRDKLHFTSIQEIRSGVRAIVMTISLTILGVSGYEIHGLLRAGQLIDKIWTLAKHGKETEIERRELYSIILKWEGDSFITDLAKLSNVSHERAILSILIPAYETMYRVVLPTLFHTQGTITFAPFVESDTGFHDLTLETQVGYSYLALIQESLRCYPVVKRLKRTGRQNVSIDIEAIHHEGWENPETFDPWRWMNGEKGKFMAFGAGRGRCIANERIVGTVVGIVMALIEEEIGTRFDQEQLRELVDNGRGK
jgi:Cytochrome P450